MNDTAAFLNCRLCANLNLIIKIALHQCIVYICGMLAVCGLLILSLCGLKITLNEIQNVMFEKIYSDNEIDRMLRIFGKCFNA